MIFKNVFQRGGWKGRVSPLAQQGSLWLLSGFTHRCCCWFHQRCHFQHFQTSLVDSAAVRDKHCGLLQWLRLQAQILSNHHVFSLQL